MRLQEVLKGKSGLKKRSRYKMRPISQGLRKIELFCQLRAMGYPEKYEQDFDEEIKRLHSEGNVDEAKLQRCRQIFQKIMEGLRREYAITEQLVDSLFKQIQKTPDYDLPLDLLKIKRGGQDTNEGRVEAAQRLAKFIGRPIHLKRWEAYEWRIKAELGRNLRQEIERRVLANIFIATDGLGGYSFKELFDEEFRPLRSFMNNLVIKDILGEDYYKWQKRKEIGRVETEWEENEEKIGEPEIPQLMSENAIDAELTLTTLISRARLSARESEFLQAMITLEEVDRVEASKKLGIKPSTGRTLWERIKKKLQSVA